MAAAANDKLLPQILSLSSNYRKFFCFINEALQDPVAQSVERMTSSQEVVCSSPALSTCTLPVGWVSV